MSFDTAPRNDSRDNERGYLSGRSPKPTVISKPAPLRLADTKNLHLNPEQIKALPKFPNPPPLELEAKPAYPNSLKALGSHEDIQPSSWENPKSPVSRPSEPEGRGLSPGPYHSGAESDYSDQLANSPVEDGFYHVNFDTHGPYPAPLHPQRTLSTPSLNPQFDGLDNKQFEEDIRRGFSVDSEQQPHLTQRRNYDPEKNQPYSLPSHSTRMRDSLQSMVSAISNINPLSNDTDPARDHRKTASYEPGPSRNHRPTTSYEPDLARGHRQTTFPGPGPLRPSNNMVQQHGSMSKVQKILLYVTSFTALIGAGSGSFALFKVTNLPTMVAETNSTMTSHISSLSNALHSSSPSPSSISTTALKHSITDRPTLTTASMRDITVTSTVWIQSPVVITSVKARTSAIVPSTHSVLKPHDNMNHDDHAIRRDDAAAAFDSDPLVTPPSTSTITVTNIVTLVSTVRMMPRYLDHPQSNDVAAWARRDEVAKSTTCNGPRSMTAFITGTITQAARLSVGAMEARECQSMGGFTWPSSSTKRTNGTSTASTPHCHTTSPLAFQSLDAKSGAGEGGDVRRRDVPLSWGLMSDDWHTLDLETEDSQWTPGVDWDSWITSTRSLDDVPGNGKAVVERATANDAQRRVAVPWVRDRGAVNGKRDEMMGTPPPRFAPPPASRTTRIPLKMLHSRRSGTYVSVSRDSAQTVRSGIF